MVRVEVKKSILASFWWEIVTKSRRKKMIAAENSQDLRMLCPLETISTGNRIWKTKKIIPLIHNPSEAKW